MNEKKTPREVLGTGNTQAPPGTGFKRRDSAPARIFIRRLDWYKLDIDA